MLAVAGAVLGAEFVLAGAELVLPSAQLGAKLVDSDTKLSNHGTNVIIARQTLRGFRGRAEFPQQRHEYDTSHSEHGLRRGDRKAQPCRRGHLHVAGALERAIQLERLADSRGRVLCCVPLDGELLGGRGLLLGLAAEWTVLLDWSANGLGRVFRGVALRHVPLICRSLLHHV